MTLERPRRWTPRDLTGAVLALLCGAAVLLVRQREPALLVPPAACPGALEWIGVAVAHLLRSVPFGVWLLRADVALSFAVVAVFAILARLSSGGWPIAAAATAAFAAQRLFAPRMSVFGPAALLIPALVLLALESRAPDARAGSKVWLGLALTAAMAALPFGAGASCTVPAWSAANLAQASDALRSSLAAAGAFACGLAVFGAFSRLHAGGERGGWIAPAFVAVSLAAAAAGFDVERLLGPATIAFWTLVAAGLAEAVRGCGAGVGGRLAAGALVMLLPVLQIPALVPRASAPAVTLRGQERASLQDVAQMLRVMPVDSAFVVEDATIDLLLRALDGTWQRSGKRLTIVPRRAADIAAVIGRPGAHVFALPATQAELGAMGFLMVDSPLFATASGIVEVRDGGACTVVDREWRAQPDLPRATAIAFVAESDADVGPMAIYAATTERPAAHPVHWPGATQRGFRRRAYDRSIDADRSRLDEAAREDGLPVDTPALTGPYVTRLELWRTPGAPHVLVVDLGAMPIGATARLQRDAMAQRLSLCPAFSFTPRRLQLSSTERR